MPPNGRSANQRRIWSARYPTTTTNLVIPASRHEVMTCSRRGMPRRGTRGLGTPPDTDAIRLPLPAARIKHSLTAVMAAHLSESVIFAKKLCCGPKEGPCVIHGFSISFADITELSGACTVLGA